MDTTVFLVRHGQTDPNVTGLYMGWSEIDLNEMGYTQARRLSERLRNVAIASIYSSPLRRAHTTAAIIAEPHRLELEVWQDLIEIQFGDWQGLHMDEIKQRWPVLWRGWRTDPSNLTLPNGESLTQAASRSISAFERIVDSNRGKQTIIVTHEVIIKVLVAYALGAPNSIYRRFDIGNTSLTVLQASNSNYRLIKLNDTFHLET